MNTYIITFIYLNAYICIYIILYYPYKYNKLDYWYKLNGILLRISTQDVTGVRIFNKDITEVRILNKVNWMNNGI